MSRHGRRHRQRGKKKAFDVATTTPVSPPTPVTGPGADASSMPSVPSTDVNDDHGDRHGGGDN
jgi:hypothetical protein